MKIYLDKMMSWTINKLTKTGKDGLKLAKSDSPIKNPDESKIMTNSFILNTFHIGVSNCLIEKKDQIYQSYFQTYKIQVIG